MNLSNSPVSGGSEELTPLMKQYWDLKSQVPDALLLFRMGDFYELFGQDAVKAAEILEITLTSRDKNKPNPVPMAGVPHHSVQNYIQRLLKAGKKIAIGEQLEDPEPPQQPGLRTSAKAANKNGPKIVRREIVRVLTPAVQFDAEGSETNYLATLVQTDPKNWVLACLEPSTGETLVSHPMELTLIQDELKRLPIRHFLNCDLDLERLQIHLADSILLEPLPKNYLSSEKAAELLKKHYEIDQLQTFLPTPEGILALGVLVLYTLRTQQQDRLAHLRLPEPLQKPKSLVLGPSTAQHLDLLELFDLVNQTKSTLGTRQLRRWIMAPLRSAAEIAIRQKGVHEIANTWSSIGPKLIPQLSQIYDLERICGRINTRLANPRDTLALGQSLSTLRNLSQILSTCQSEVLKDLQVTLEKASHALTPVAEKILRIQKEEAPLVSRDGGIFKTGTTPELDHLISLTEDGQRWLVELEARERELTGISSLKVRYNRVFGYYIEITQTHLKNVPSHYQRKQTMVGAERFFTEELKKFEEEILTAAVKQKSLEQEIFQQLIAEIQALTSPIMESARGIGQIDALVSLALLAHQPGWSFPEIDESLNLDIQAGRHPVVAHVKRGSFIPNDLSLSPQSRLTLLITGPNMGGKSTVMRQVALIVILGQMGAPIPAKSGKWGAVSSLYTRIGAQDAISKGQSTFMVEMSELAHILHHADERSLIILDEIGRGTSTYDGISVAWSTLEWICNKIQARTLFATHYHELIRLATTLPLLANAHMAVEGTKGQNSKNLRFLYELREGPTNESFGIHVAQLAGLPKSVIQRAWKILHDLENTSGGRNKDSLNQLSLFGGAPQTHMPVDEGMWVEEEVAPPPPAPEPHPAVLEIQKVNLNEMTPMQALLWVAKLQELCKEQSVH
jgi:DNA mismatch repair protein MutS